MWPAPPLPSTRMRTSSSIACTPGKTTVPSRRLVACAIAIHSGDLPCALRSCSSVHWNGTGPPSPSTNRPVTNAAGTAHLHLGFGGGEERVLAQHGARCPGAHDAVADRDSPQRESSLSVAPRLRGAEVTVEPDVVLAAQHRGVRDRPIVGVDHHAAQRDRVPHAELDAVGRALRGERGSRPADGVPRCRGEQCDRAERQATQHEHPVAVGPRPADHVVERRPDRRRDLDAAHGLAERPEHAALDHADRILLAVRRPEADRGCHEPTPPTTPS